MRTTPSWAALLALLPLLVLTGCGASGTPVVSGATAAATYDLSLVSTPGPTTGQARVGWPGAAGTVVRCSGPVTGSTSTAPYAGEDTGATPQAALDAARRWYTWDGAQDGFVLARVEPARRLYVLEVTGVAKQALILRHGPALTGDGSRDTVTRWWLESWARCDYAELPDRVAREQGLEIWTDRDGRRQPTSTIVSFRSTGDCFAGMTSLDLRGPGEGGSKKGPEPIEYVSHPPAELRTEYFERDFVEHVAVPADAVDSGYERDGDHLWLSKNRGTAFVGQRQDADAWPKAVRPIRCA
jgi:hypothetical protein